jgi:tripartite ATP-independent transporter DctP family solute receptor
MNFKQLIMAAVFATVSMQMAHAQVTAKLAYVPTEDHPVGQGVNKFIDLVKTKSNGKIIIKPYSSGTLGNEPQLQSSLQGGVLDIMVGPTSNFVGAIKEFGIYDLPFFYANFKEVDAVMDGRVGKSLLQKLEGIGIVGLAMWDNGFRHMTNAKRQILKADDMKGLKIRVIPNPLFLATFKALGTNPIGLPYPELYNALESKAVDAQETPVGLIYSSKFYEVQKYLTMTGHIYTPYMLLASTKWFNALADADKKIVMEAAQESAVFQRKLSRDNADNLAFKVLKDRGMDVVVLPPDEMAKLRNLVKPVQEEFSKIIGEDLVNQARADMASTR